MNTENRLYLPLQYIEDEQTPVIFLAGPIVGAQNWQELAADRILKDHPPVLVANPRRKVLDAEFDSREQTSWERFHLARAGKNGVILFWLEKEFRHYCERPYARTTRFELGKWMARYQLWSEGKVKLVLGIEEGFSGAVYIRNEFKRECPELPIFNTLSHTIQETLRLLTT